jgi:nitrite reductase (NO-forming)
MRLAKAGSRRGLSTEGGVLIIVIVLLGGTMVMVIDQSQGMGDQIATLQKSVSALAKTVSSLGTGGNATSGTPVTPTTRHIVMYTYPKVIEVAKGVNYLAWTFNGTVPGPNVFVNQGDNVVFKLINNSTMPHSMDFHAAEIDWATAYSTVAPGGTKSFNFTANYPGVFMYHCGTPPVLEHIGNGMYGAIVVNPSVPLPPAPGGSFVLIESEFYGSMGANHTLVGNYTKMLTAYPDYVVFNGKASKYMASPLVVQPNQRVRLYLLNVGPSLWEAFHVIGALMDTVYFDGNPANPLKGLQTVNLAPSNGAIVDMYFRDPGGKNPFVNHAFAWASRGAIGVFVVAGHASQTTTTTTTTQAGVTVVIPDGSGANVNLPGYAPAKITVMIGINSTVTWVNRDSVPHTVTATGGSFNSGNIDPGKSWTYTFNLPGTYTYYCAYHSWMKGTVIVLAMH